MSYSLSKSMNNVGENFFSLPIGPFDLSDDWGRSDDDQRHRLVVNDAVNSSMAPARSTWDKISHGYPLSAMMQAYSAPPFNITSGVTTLQGTTGRPIVNGQYITRNAGTGSDFLRVNLRISRAFAVGAGARLEGVVEAFNLTNRRNDLTRNGNFGPGMYPEQPLASSNQITAVADPRTLQGRCDCGSSTTADPKYFPQEEPDMTRMRMTLVHGIVATLMLAGTVLVSAHMKLEKSEPAEGSTVTAPPADVQLFFNETPDAAVSKLELKGPAATTKLVGMHVMDKSLMASVQGEMPDGAYTVQWQGAGTDGHVQKGEVKFVLKRAK